VTICHGLKMPAVDGEMRLKVRYEQYWEAIGGGSFTEMKNAQAIEARKKVLEGLLDRKRKND
jgi:hypothetical protein